MAPILPPTGQRFRRHRHAEHGDRTRRQRQRPDSHHRHRPRCPQQVGHQPAADKLYRIAVYVATPTSRLRQLHGALHSRWRHNFVELRRLQHSSVAASTTDFTQVTCYITTDATTATNPYIYFTQTDGTGRTFYVDTFSVDPVDQNHSERPDRWRRQRRPGNAADAGPRCLRPDRQQQRRPAGFDVLRHDPG